MATFWLQFEVSDDGERITLDALPRDLYDSICSILSQTNVEFKDDGNRLSFKLEDAGQITELRLRDLHHMAGLNALPDSK